MTRERCYDEKQQAVILKALRIAKEGFQNDSALLANALLIKLMTLKNWERRKNPTSPSKANIFRLATINKEAAKLIEESELLGPSKFIYSEINNFHQISGQGLTQGGNDENGLLRMLVDIFDNSRGIESITINSESEIIIKPRC